MDDAAVVVISKLGKELKAAAIGMRKDEARFLVDSYYGIQDYRIQLANQLRSAAQEVDEQPVTVLSWIFENMRTLENQIKLALRHFALNDAVGKWSMEVCGIGEIISAGLLAHIDITQAPTVGHIWSFAGLDPTKEWNKGEKRPWNAKLKTLCWKIGESFVKVSGREQDVYGKFYLQRKAEELVKNENGDFAQQAKEKLEKFKISKKTDAYKAYSVGKLPPAHIHARAKRYAVKLFLAHWHEIAYKMHYGKEPLLPYPIAVLGHAHKIDVPNQSK